MWRETEVILRLMRTRKTEAKEKNENFKECKRSTQARRTDIGRFICLAEHVNFQNPRKLDDALTYSRLGDSCTLLTANHGSSSKKFKVQCVFTWEKGQIVC